MPLYDYDCLECGRRIEVVHGVHAPGPSHCPNCGGGPLKKAITAAAVHFKGSGWAKKERRATVASGASQSTDATSEGDGDGKGDREVPATQGEAAERQGSEGQGKDGGGSATETTAATSSDRGSMEPRGGGEKRASGGKRPAAPSGPAPAGTAHKTD